MDAVFSAPTIEEILVRLDALGSAEWAVKAAAAIRRNSPTSLKVTLRQMREGRRLAAFDDCMRMEYRIVERVMRGHDFFEGVRAAILDKDNAPAWRPATLAEVGEADVAGYFRAAGRRRSGAGTMSLQEERKARSRVTFEVVLIWYLRGLALLFLLGGLVYWLRILGLPIGGKAFAEMTIEWRVSTVYFAVLDLVAAVGLWLGVSWGSVMWMLAALTQVVMFLGLFDIFGFDLGLVVFHLVTIVVYFMLTYWVHQEAHA
ncbi:MAG: DUF6163 family protein [Hyphomicrobiales bacterium]